MEETVLELQELPETDELGLEPAMCCDADHTSGQCTTMGPHCKEST
ncbi:hypothetical protein [Streptomyces sp. UNOC14_S4]|nr:hypothetical protein [Streptomyces sp. UNOC14_S4]MCC3771295.1 hypothetical protein [Streptomyces sp. UNOC14_S4]